MTTPSVVQRWLWKPLDLQAAGMKLNEATCNTFVFAYVCIGDVLAGEAMVRDIQKLGARSKSAVRTLTTLVNAFVEHHEFHKARMVRGGRWWML